MKSIQEAVDLEKTRGIALLLLFVCLACSQVQSPGFDDETISTEEISPLDGNNILQFKDKDFLHNSYIEAYKERIIAQYGNQLIHAVNEQSQKAKANTNLAGEIILLKDIPSLKAKSTESLSTHFRVVDEEGGGSEDFALGIREYIADGGEYLKKGTSGLSEQDTWLALDPDKFYLEDDEEGNEVWPITFEAIHITDANRKLSVTFHKSGLVSAQEKGKAKMINDPAMMFLEPVPILDTPCDDPTLIVTCDDGGSSGGGGSTSGSRNNDWTRGPSTGTHGGNDTYFVIKSMRLVATGDGSGASELQMFVKKDDNYQNNMPVSYKYRFDKVVRYDPVSTFVTHNSIIDGGDQGWPYYIKYKVPDINNKGQDYNFNITRYDLRFGKYQSSSVDYFPLFNLTETGGPWRFVLSDDDKDYADFSRRRASSYATNIQTYHMDDGVWRSVYTGFTVRRKTFGSSDDPILESGVRRINRNNVTNQSDSFGNVIATKYYGSDLFRYKFALKTY